MPRNHYPRRFRREVWDPPAWVFAPGVTLSSGRAAKFLGIGKNGNRHILIKHADNYGLTVIRRGRDKRTYFLMSELKALKREMGEVTLRDVMRARKGDRHAVLG